MLGDRKYFALGVYQNTLFSNRLMMELLTTSFFSKFQGRLSLLRAGVADIPSGQTSPESNNGCDKKPFRLERKVSVYNHNQYWLFF
jgi:hypothetical protein